VCRCFLQNLLVRQLVNELRVHFHQLDGPTLLSSPTMPGPKRSDAKTSSASDIGEGDPGSATKGSNVEELSVLSAVFQTAMAHEPAIIFIDEIDAIGRAREPGETAAISKLRASLRAEMDKLLRSRKNVIVLAATNVSSSVSL
jgi:SpoVK/Ycf46/Vps4 family AAA+-type ATPase